MGSKQDLLDWLYGLTVHGIKLGLTNTTELLHRLGDPQNSFRKVHIAGTDGKGSTSAMIASIIRAAGVKVGLYTSPHIIDFNERISVSGENITGSMSRIEDMLDTTIEAYKKQLDALFANQAADIQMDIEIMNATNDIMSPNITIPTNLLFLMAISLSAAPGSVSFLFSFMFLPFQYIL